MPIRLETPLVEDFILEEIDKKYGLDKTAEPTKVRIQQATQGAHERRSGLFDKMQREVLEEEQGTRVVATTYFNIAQLQRLEVYLTMIDCNIEDESGKPLFRFKSDKLDMTEVQFKKAWDKLPSDVAEAIHDRVLEINIGWDFLGEK